VGVVGRLWACGSLVIGRVWGLGWFGVMGEVLVFWFAGVWDCAVFVVGFCVDVGAISVSSRLSWCV